MEITTWMTREVIIITNIIDVIFMVIMMMMLAW